MKQISITVRAGIPWSTEEARKSNTSNRSNGEQRAAMHPDANLPNGEAKVLAKFFSQGMWSSYPGFDWCCQRELVHWYLWYLPEICCWHLLSRDSSLPLSLPPFLLSFLPPFPSSLFPPSLPLSPISSLHFFLCWLLKKRKPSRTNKVAVPSKKEIFHEAPKPEPRGSFFFFFFFFKPRGLQPKEPKDKEKEKRKIPQERRGEGEARQLGRTLYAFCFSFSLPGVFGSSRVPSLLLPCNGRLPRAPCCVQTSFQQWGDRRTQGVVYGPGPITC